MTDHQPSLDSISSEPQDPVFPLEIFELIIEIVAGDGSRRCLNKSVIASLSLVSKAFADLCRPHLFRDVDIYMDRPLNHLQRLAGAIKDTPTLAKYIHNLSYYEPSIRFQVIEAEEDGSLDAFLHLTSVRYLKVDGRGDYSYDVPEPNAKRFGYRSLLDSYISSGTLTTLCIRSIADLPIIDIMSCPNLEDLELRYCTLRGWNTPLPAEVLTKGFNIKMFSTCSAHDVAFPLLVFCPKLESISLAKMGGFSSAKPQKFPVLALPITSFDHVKSIESRGSVDWTYFCVSAVSAGVRALPNLKHLKLELYTMQDIFHGANVLFQHVDSLEELKLKVGNSLAPNLLIWAKCFTLSARTLKSIIVDWTLEQGQDALLLKIFCNALQGTAHANAIQRISISLKITTNGEIILGPQFQQWGCFDRLMIDDDRVAFPHLKEVKVYLRISRRGDSGETTKGEKECAEHLRSSLSRLIAHPDIEVKCTVFLSS